MLKKEISAETGLEVSTNDDGKSVSQTIGKPNVVRSGYWCSLAGDDVFIIAENIADCMDKLELIGNGQRYEMRKHKSIPVYHCS